MASSDGYAKQIKKLRKLAAKGKAGLFIAACILAVYVIFRAIWRRLKTPVWRIAVALTVVCITFINTSFSAESYNDVVDYDSLYDAYMKDPESANDLTPEELMQARDGNEMAGLDDLIASREGEVEVEEKQEETTPAEEIVPETPQFNKSDWNLTLVNKTHTIPDDYTFTLGTIKGAMKCDERIIEPLTKMFKDAAEDGITLIVMSPYRDIALQEKLFERKMQRYIASGYSYMDAYKEASAVVTVPGTSEHQLGLALDIVCDYYTDLSAGFGDTEAGKWLRDNSYKYGFILRYPKEKEDITGIIYEPWHFRYVGVEAATIIHDKNICLEEFIDSL